MQPSRWSRTVRISLGLLAAAASLWPVPAKAQAASPPPEEEVVEAALPKHSPKGTSIELYGFAMLDSGYEFNEIDPQWFDTMRPTKLPAFAGEFAPDGNVYASVRQTRFGVRSSTPTGMGDLKAIFEFEMFGVGADAGQTTIRLRHAYGELGQFGAGQFWSPFMDIDVFPNSLEYWGPNGMVFFRNVQIRWMPLKGESRVTVALERPGASADLGTTHLEEPANVVPHFNLPDLSAEARMGRPWGYVEIAGILRKIAWVDTTATATRNLSDSVLGWGVNLSSNLKATANDTLRLQVVGGRGIENYMNDAPVDIATRPTANPAVPEGVPLGILGLVAFLDHNWNKMFSSAVGYSMVNIWNSQGQLARDFHQGHYALGNLLFTPVKNVMMGGEFQWGRRVNAFDGYSVDDWKIQLSFKYSFSGKWTIGD
jgi:hypothetical protein